ncbi:MAG: FkbM family methyltransferase, partial [Bacteroidetes bacterium]
TFLTLRGRNWWDTLQLWSSLGAFALTGRLIALVPIPAWRQALYKRRWRSFFPRAQRRLVYWKKQHRWTDLAHLLHTRGKGDFPDHYVRFSPGEVGFQIGANRGEYTFQAAQAIGSEGLCIALEPNPTAYLDLLELAHLNQAANVITLPFACGEAYTHATFSAHTDAAAHFGDWVFSMSREVPPEHAVVGFTARVVPLDGLVKGLGLTRVDFLIIDVEGAELAVLQGAQETLRTFRPRLLIELHGTGESVLPFLQGLGYEVAGLVGDSPDRLHLLALPAAHSEKSRTFGVHGGYSSGG